MRPPDDQLAWKIVLEYQGWLRVLCRAWAIKLRDHGDVAQFTEDILQGAIVRAVKSAPRYLAGPARTTFERQVKHWLSLCVKQEYSALRRHHEALPEDRGLDAADGEERSAGRDEGPGPEDQLGDEQSRALVRRLAAADPGTSPWCHLAAVAFFVPEVVKRQHLERANGYRKGGFKGLRRPVDESWRLFLDGRERIDSVDDETGWKRYLTELFLFGEPFGEADPTTVIEKVKSFEMQIRRGLENLRDPARALELAPDEEGHDPHDEGDR